MLNEEKDSIRSGRVVEILSRLCTTPARNFRSLTPRVIRILYNEVSTHILKNYIPKESWLRQCYSIQNGSFQNLLDMEKVPMSKFMALCIIHKEAIDQMNNPPQNDLATSEV